mmetsp:Transcript_23183/g.36930  ORF Transcript_23183/g.36930 Transcript_23183/m.36930 type:complete len:701 (-) Transcript_23183:178-2280(-)
MYHAPAEVVAATCGHLIVPIWANACPGLLQPPHAKEQRHPSVEKFLESLPSAQHPYVNVPAYIASGLLQFMELNHAKMNVDNIELAKIGSGTSHAGVGDQAFHQEMLRKLALHLAAQPDTQVDSKPPQRNEQLLNQDAQSEQTRTFEHVGKNTCPKFDSESFEANKDTKGKGLSVKDQEFQQEMLRKLALHLAAQAEAEDHSDKTVGEKETSPKEAAEDDEIRAIVTPEVFPATPSSLGETQCDHYYIGDDDCHDRIEETNCCWPYSTQFVRVPMHIAYGLLDGFSIGQHSSGCNQYCKLRPEEQDFHHQMLQKLALHLAAQPDSNDQPDQKLPTPLACPKVSWADMVDETIDTTCIVDTIKTDPKGKQRSSAPTKAKLGKLEQEEFQQDMLRKLALHLAAQPDVPAQQPEHDIALLGQDKARCDQLIKDLECTSRKDGTARKASILDWVIPASRPLTLTQSGSRLVQKVIDVASTEQRARVLEILLDDEDITGLYTSPHANHVIAKLIEILPSKNIASVCEALRGKATTVARHQFGSRILERLVQFSNEDCIGFLIDELLEDLEALARHQFGNFIVARLLEHGSPARKHNCVQILLPHVLQHATHKTACNIVQRMLEHADLNSQAMIADAFLAGSGETSLEAIAMTRYGSFVIQHLVDRFHPRIDSVKSRIKVAHSQLCESGFSRRKIVDLLGEAFFRD